MCGIWGIVNDSTHRIDVPSYTALGELNLARGSRGHGVYAWGYDIEMLLRQQDSYSSWLYTLEWAQVALAHNLAPTGEPGHPHPFEIDHLLLAHNGILVDWEALKPWRPASLNQEVDTTVILGGIWFHAKMGMQLTDAILRVLPQLSGQHACWLFDRKEKCIYLWRVMSTLWMGETKTAIYFSSAKTYLTTHELPEGILYKIDLSVSVPQLEMVGQFPYNSIYKERP